MKQRTPSVVLVGALALSVLLVAQPAAVEITNEPHHHLILQNESVRVFRVEVPPGDPTLMHHHAHDYVWTSLGAADINNQVEGKPPARLQFKDGETRFTAANFSHIVTDFAPAPFRNITVEILQDEKLRNAPSPWDPAKNEDRGLQVFTGGTKQILFVKDSVRVSELELQPGAVIPSHHHNGPHLVIAITDFDLRSDVEGKKPVPLHAKAGDASWIPGGYTHTVTNESKQPAKFVTLEFP